MRSICTTIAVTVALSREELLTAALALLGASVGHNAAGFLLGYAGARALGPRHIDGQAVAVEVGIQNGAKATGLAFGVFGS